MWHEEKRTGGASADWGITPTNCEMLAVNRKYSRLYKSQKSAGNLWQVSRGVESSYAVDLDAKTCGCRRWDMTGIPCSHAISAIFKSKQKPEGFIHDFFKKPMYLEAYKPVIYPVPSQDQWTKTHTCDIHPPVFRIEKGRHQSKRRKGKFEVLEPKDTSRMATITCSNCKFLGHRYTSCTKPLNPQLEMRKNQHKVKYSMFFIMAEV